MKLKYDGWIYAMILPKNTAYDSLMINLHTKYGLNIKDQKSIWKHTWQIFNVSETIYMNIYNMPLVSYSTDIEDYTLFYYATDLRTTVSAGQTALYSIDFQIGWRIDVNSSYYIQLKITSVVILLAFVFTI